MCKIITLSQLKAAGACANALQRFAAAFGESTPVTLALAGKYADKFDWEWAASYLLPMPTRTEYEIVVAQARGGYSRAIEEAWADYEEAIDPAQAEYDRAEYARVKCNRTIASAQAKYDRACARAWATLYIKEGI